MRRKASKSEGERPMVSFDTVRSLTEQGFGGRHVGNGRYEIVPVTNWMAPGVACPGGVVKAAFWKCIAWDCSKCPMKECVLE